MPEPKNAEEKSNPQMTATASAVNNSGKGGKTRKSVSKEKAPAALIPPSA